MTQVPARCSQFIPVSCYANVLLDVNHVLPETNQGRDLTEAYAKCVFSAFYVRILFHQLAALVRVPI